MSSPHPQPEAQNHISDERYDSRGKGDGYQEKEVFHRPKPKRLNGKKNQQAKDY